MRTKMAKLNDKNQESRIPSPERSRPNQETRIPSPGPSRYPSRAICIWVFDALKKDTERRKEEIRRLNKDIINGDIRSDAMVVTERYKKSSTEWQSFRTLYGLTPDNMDNIGIVYSLDTLFIANML